MRKRVFDIVLHPKDPNLLDKQFNELEKKQLELLLFHSIINKFDSCDMLSIIHCLLSGSIGELLADIFIDRLTELLEEDIYNRDGVLIYSNIYLKNGYMLLTNGDIDEFRFKPLQVW
jgi:hypothetical protein